MSQWLKWTSVILTNIIKIHDLCYKWYTTVIFYILFYDIVNFSSKNYKVELTFAKVESGSHALMIESTFRKVDDNFLTS